MNIDARKMVNMTRMATRSVSIQGSNTFLRRVSVPTIRSTTFRNMRYKIRIGTARNFVFVVPGRVLQRSMEKKVKVYLFLSIYFSRQPSILKFNLYVLVFAVLFLVLYQQHIPFLVFKKFSVRLFNRNLYLIRNNTIYFLIFLPIYSPCDSIFLRCTNLAGHF